jgi:hypothetical protein
MNYRITHGKNSLVSATNYNLFVRKAAGKAFASRWRSKVFFPAIKLSIPLVTSAAF